MTSNGTAIAHDGHEKAYDPVPWLEYLIHTFLQPEGAASPVDDLLPGIPEGVIWAGLPYEPELDRHRNAAAVRRAAYDERLSRRVS